MACKNVCKLCDKLIISTGVYYIASSGVVINLPEGTYYNGEKYCIVVAQPIPTNALVNSPVVVRIGTDTTDYPLVKCDCSQVTVCSIRTRTKYSTRLVTDGTNASFKLLGKVCCAPNNNLASITG